jgi:hypothetical protein
MSELLNGMMDVSNGPSTTIITVDRSFNPPLVVDEGGRQFGIASLSVDYHVIDGTFTHRIDAGDRIAELILRSLDGNFDRVIWNKDLQQFEMDPDGTVRNRLPGR